MPGMVFEKGRNSPLVLVETENLTREEWLDWRRKGIGGSDAAAIMGISPFRTARDIYYDKLGIAAVEENESNWVALEMGHLLEDLVAKIFGRKTGLKLYQIKKMFQHPLFPFMLADVDYFITMPDGTEAILEIKTTNYNAKDLWWKDGREIVPVYYEAQGRHYMAVMDIDRVFFCCLYGNTEDEVIIREIRRDTAYEEEMIPGTGILEQLCAETGSAALSGGWRCDPCKRQAVLRPCRQGCGNHYPERHHAVHADALHAAPGAEETVG